MKPNFNYHSEAARKARFFVRFSKNMRTALSFVIALAAIGGVMLWVAESFILGSLLAGLAAVLLLPVVWYEYDITKRTASDIEADLHLEKVLAPDVVGRLRSISSPYGVWAAIDGTWQQRFFSARYGLGRDVFNSLSKEKAGMDQVWTDAVALSQKHQHVGISTAALLVALVKTIPNYEQVIGAVNLDIEELESSIDWLQHTEGVIKRLGSHQHFGGLARDWTSGYTPTLNQMSHNMTIDIEHGGYSHRDLEAHRATIDEMTKFMAVGRQNTLLVGEVGVGKTISVYGLTQRIATAEGVPESLKFKQVFLLNPSSIISLAGDGVGVEVAINNIIAEAQKSKNAILFFDDAYSFFSEGTGAIDLSRVLLPLIEGAAVPMIFSMTPTEWQEVSAKNQALAGVLNYIMVKESTRDQSLRVMEDQALMIEAKHNVLVTFQALEQAVDLSERYIQDIAAPGRALRLLENAVNHAEGKTVTAVSVQQSVEATQGVKVQVATGSEKEDLLHLETDIHDRMIGQKRAVEVISDALRRARSGVNNPNKPMGTFLFLGPTGVGKTELSKAVAGVFFGNDKNMVRVDMNEFTQSSDVARLLDTKSLTSFLSAVGRNPFTVVLFDEIEKAHPEVVNVLLQLLDEGVMRSDANKEVSFKDAIVIATSNAGANSIRAYIDAGQTVEQFEKPFVDSLIDANLFKPEFLNRFDEMVVFAPLTEKELVKVVDLLMQSVNKNLAKQKVSVELTSAAKKWLAAKGYDPRLGARPLRRMVQRTVENVVAKKLLSSEFKAGTMLTLDVPDLESEAR